MSVYSGMPELYLGPSTAKRLVIAMPLLLVCGGCTREETVHDPSLLCGVFEETPAPFDPVTTKDVPEFLEPAGDTAPAVGSPSVLWKIFPNDPLEIGVQFVGERRSPALERLVMDVAGEWATSGTNLKFVQAPRKNTIRIQFVPGTISHSELGIKAAQNPKRSSMQLALSDINDPATQRWMILHEFGHALGLLHEHQRSDSGICLDLNRIKKSYPFHQDTELRKEFLITSTGPLGCSTRFDPHSVMMYSIKKEWNCRGDLEVAYNAKLSDLDRELIAKLYPKRGERDTMCQK